MYKENVNCPLDCDTENIHEDTQSHILSCKSLQKPKDQILVKMDQIFVKVCTLSNGDTWGAKGFGTVVKCT